MTTTTLDPEAEAPEFLEVKEALVLPVIETTPPPPAVGIHFGMSEEDYHALPAFSMGGLKHILCSTTTFWAGSWLNPDREEEVKTHFSVGKAYHAMILEGRAAYTSRFYAAPDPADYPKALKSVDEIKDELKRQHQTPVSKIDLPDGKQRAAKKEDWVAQLMSYDRSAQVWDDIIAKAERIAGGRTMISIDDDRQIRIAARMIAMDPQLAKAFTGGYPEVVLIWRDPRQGVLCKCRVDYLKLRAVVDLKSFANSRDRSIRNAILRTIAEQKYCLQPAVYLQGVDEVRKLVRTLGLDAVHWHWDAATVMREDDPMGASLNFALEWAKNTVPDRWLWVFQGKGDAPVTRGFWHPLGGTVHSIAQGMFTDGLRRFREAAETYGNDVWLDLAEIDDIDESEIPMWGLEI